MTTVAPAIGPATEALITAAFAESCLITAKSAAKLLGMDVDSLAELTDAGVIRAVRRGASTRTRGYTEGDIRAFLTQGAAPARERKPVATHRGDPKVVPFSQRKRPNARR